MYIVFVDDAPDDHERVASCIPFGKFDRLEPYSSPEELQQLIEDITALRKDEPALVLLDMAIGSDERCGLTMLKRVREAIPHMPVVIVSQSGMKPLITESFENGACSYIQKSVVPEAFEATIHKMLKYWNSVSKIPSDSHYV
jgi:DNA-binding NarL/FixJ family response regulator